MKLRSAPYWYDRFPTKRRPSFPRQRGDVQTRVVIIGGGLAGCACACALASSRIAVALVEAEQIGAGATAASAGIVREDFDVSFEATASAHGLRAARTMWKGMHRAALELPAALRRLHIRCDLAPQDLLTVAPPDRTVARQLRREYESRKAAGLDHRWINKSAIAREAAVDTSGAIKTRAVVLDPYRACVGLAAAAASRGAVLFERSPVRRIRAGRKSVEVRTAAGAITADLVVVATGAPLPDLRQLRRHLDPRRAYSVVTAPLPAAVRREVGTRATVLRDSATPPHFVRWLHEDRVLVAGADHAPVPARAEPQTLVQRTGQLMYELSLLYPAISGTMPEWSSVCAYEATSDGLPYIGTHRNFPRHFFALGLARHGAGAAWLAARLLARHVAEDPAKGDELFGFARILGGH
jgi:glycine/D-amino acid oxidase-like deaminating enzyme